MTVRALAAALLLLAGCRPSPAPPRADVIGIDPPLESVPAAVVHLEWTNTGPDPVRVVHYRLEWPGGALEVNPADAVIPAGGTRARTTRVDLRAGELPRDPARVRVTDVRAERV